MEFDPDENQLRNRNTALALVIKVVGEKDYSLLDSLISSNFIVGNPVDLPRTSFQGLRGLENRIRTFHLAFPDLKIKINEILSNEDTVFVNYEMTGSHLGTFMGAPPTGKKIFVRVFHLIKFNNEGKIISTNLQYNSLEMFVQLNLANLITQETSDIIEYLKIIINEFGLVPEG